jgi:hypothetical protein
MRLYPLAPGPAAPAAPTRGLSLLADRRRVGRAGAPGAAPRQPAGWPAPQAPAAPDHRRDPLPGPLGLRLAAAAPRVPTPGHGVLVVCQVGRRRHPGSGARYPARAGPPQAGRNLVPSAAIIDSQSVRAGDTVPRRSRGWDAGKKVNGRKRHLVVDTLGLLLVVMVTAASIQDRDAGPALWRLRASFRGVRPCWADGGYAGRLVAWGSRSCASARASRPSRCCRAGGWWSGPWRGSPSIAAPCATTSGCPTITPRWSPGPWSR